MIGLPDTTAACLFDMDGVLTATAELHRIAWTDTFNALLRERSAAEFTEADYLTYVDGRSRLDGVRTFLAARGIDLPAGSPDDALGTETVHGIGNRKNDMLRQSIAEHGVRVYPGSLRYLEAVRDAGLSIGIVTSSANGELVVHSAGLSEFTTALVDGKVIEREALRGKPAPDSFLAGARSLGVAPADVAVFEDALSGVRAGRAGGFGRVIGVDRSGQAEALRDNGAHLVVNDLAELLDEGNG